MVAGKSKYRTSRGQRVDGEQSRRRSVQQKVYADASKEVGAGKRSGVRSSHLTCSASRHKGEAAWSIPGSVLGVDLSQRRASLRVRRASSLGPAALSRVGANKLGGN